MMKNKNFEQKQECPEKQEEEKKEKKYQLINHVRFQESIPREVINSWLSDEEEPKKFRYMANDDLCYFEHISIGGTSPSSLRPLTPYSVLAGEKTVEELSDKGRNRKASIHGFYVVDPSRDYQTVFGGKGKFILDIPESVKKDFFKWLLSVEDAWKIDSRADNGLLEIFCEFDKPDFDEKSGRIILPNLLEVNHVTVPKSIATKIKLKEWISNEGEKIRTIVDEEGWRIDLID